MSQFKRGLLLMAMVAVVALMLHPAAALAAQGGRSRISLPTPTGPITPTRANFKTSDLEYYLNDDGIAYIRPGVMIKNIKITNVVAGQKPVVEFDLTDKFGNPLDRLGAVTPGPITPAFILVRWEPTTRLWTPLTIRIRSGVPSGTTDSGGSYDLTTPVGHYKYTFGMAVPANIAQTDTLTLAMYAKRTTIDLIGKDYFADNVFVNFRPDGGAIGPTWGAMSSVAATCNKCHDQLGDTTGGPSFHGGQRRDPQICGMCHTTVLGTPTGAAFNKVFFHKLHMGKDLPSVVAGTPYVMDGDWSTVAFPQDIRNCTTCHDAAAKEKEIWYTRPTALVCGSCHDNVNFATGANHPGGPQSDDSACANCHVPDSGKEFDASIVGAHTIPLKSTQMMNYVATVVSVSNVGPGKKPTVVFNVKDKNGNNVDGTKLSSFSAKLGGPTSSYTTYFAESVVANATNKNPGTYDPATGNTTFTFANAIPATESASSTWTISADIYNSVTLKKADGTDVPGSPYRDAAVNPVKYIALDGSANFTARRTSVQISLCNDCHKSLALHGDQRKNIDECVICHNPTEGDQARRPATEGNKESVSFQRLIHRLHTGEELTQDFTVFGFGGSRNNFNEVRFPGDRRDCVQCHVNAAAIDLPVKVPFGQGTVTTLRDYFSPQSPNAAACLGCHDDSNAAAHAYLNTVTFPGATVAAEACAACHSSGKDWDVAKVHAK